MKTFDGPSTRRLLLATTNKAKIREYRELLREAGYELVTLDERTSPPVEETGKTLEENAVSKALTYASLHGCLALADDSGLEVEALGGEPGPLSARYAGAGATDEEKIGVLLGKLARVPWERRQARFRCVIAVAEPGGKVETAQGECQGLITFQPAGENGFGYDPIFYLPEIGKTMAELAPEHKNLISHRGIATRHALEIISRYCQIRNTE